MTISIDQAAIDLAVAGGLSAAIYDASMVALNNHWGNRNKIEADKAKVRQRMADATGVEFNFIRHAIIQLVGRLSGADAGRCARCLSQSKRDAEIPQ
jgi:hypothetical protein